VHVFDRPRAVVVHGGDASVAFVGFPYTRRIRQRFAQVYAAATREAVAADVVALCMHQCVEGATCGPGAYVFRFGDEVIRARDLPRNVAVTLCGHIHRHQVVRPRGGPPVVYAGSTERTSFAEASETKGYVVLELTRSGLGPVEFRPLDTRPMQTRALSLDGLDAGAALARLGAAIASTPDDAVVQVRVGGAVPAGITAQALRALSGARNVTLRVTGAGSGFAAASSRRRT
jgi:DNA repair exonuclease SbcCD nuclease subunit